MVNRKDFFLIAILILFLDQITKIIVQQRFFAGESADITSFFSLTFVKNTGIAWGFLAGKGYVSILVSLLVIGAIAYYFSDIFSQNQTTRIAVALILAGALGNLIDRLALGYVVDFLDFHFWPTFNVADSALTVGAVLFAFFQNSSKSLK